MSPTHSALFTTSPSVLQIRQVPTPTPGPDEVLLKVSYTSSGPFDLHVAHGWLLIDAPRAVGSAFAGTVHSTHPSVTTLSPGDQIFGFLNGPSDTQRAHQEYAIVPAWRAAKVPKGMSLQEAVTVPENVVTIFQAASVDLGLELPWPRPASADWKPEHAEAPVLIWGGAGSVGQYALQVFRHWGYKNLIATASERNFELVRGLGARVVFDYRDPKVVEKILQETKGEKVFVFDTVGHKEGTVGPLARLTRDGDRVAVVLPVVVRDAAEGVRPEYEMDAEKAGEWREGVKVSGIRAHFYARNEVFKQKLLPEMVPKLLEEGVVKPNKVRVVEGRDILERATNALDILRKKEQSAERLVWRVADE